NTQRGRGPARNRLDGDPEVRMLDRTGRDQLGGDRVNGVRGDREADTFVAAARALDLRRYPDHPSEEIEERTARVAVVDGGVGLDGVVDREVVRRCDIAVERAHDPGGDRVLETERAADRDDAV